MELSERAGLRNCCVIRAQGGTALTLLLLQRYNLNPGSFGSEFGVAVRERFITRLHRYNAAVAPDLVVSPHGLIDGHWVYGATFL
eukprot:bmy_13358T0